MAEFSHRDDGLLEEAEQWIRGLFSPAVFPTLDEFVTSKIRDAAAHEEILSAVRRFIFSGVKCR